jgi:hypothetical protein
MWPVWHPKPEDEPHLVASWHSWHLWEVAPGRYEATDGDRHFGVKGERDHVLLVFCVRCREEARATSDPARVGLSGSSLTRSFVPIRRRPGAPSAGSCNRGACQPVEAAAPAGAGRWPPVGQAPPVL